MQLFYKALVIDNDSKNGDRRVKVRVLGIHPFEGELDYSNVPDESLPWAKIAPSISSSNSKEKFNVPENGQWVWVFFEDEGFQQPIYFAFVSSDTDVNANFKPNKNTITTDRYNGQEQVITNDYQSNITNGNGLLLSTNDNKALLTNNKVAFLLNREHLQCYVGCDQDQSEQSMVYGNQMLDCLQSTLSTMEQSFKGYKKDYNDKKIDVEGSIGQQIPNSIFIDLGMDMPFSVKDLQEQINASKTDIEDKVNDNKEEIKELQNEIEELTEELKNNPMLTPAEKEKIKKQIEKDKKKKSALEKENEMATGEANGNGKEGALAKLNSANNKLSALSSIPSEIEVDLTDTKENVLQALASTGMDKTVAMGTQWVGEPFYTARISLAFLNLYKIIDNLYSRIVYLETAKDTKEKRANSDKWDNKESKEGDLDRYKGINDVSNNLKNTLNNAAVFNPMAEDMNQLIIDEIGEGVTQEQLSATENFNIVKSTKLSPSNIKYIVIHCSASTFGDAESINKIHVRQNGWTKIGYHYVILNGYRDFESFKKGAKTSDGLIETGRIITDEYVERGAHEPKFNSNSIGICLIGGQTENFDGTGTLIEDFSSLQVAALIAKVKELMDKYNIPKENVIGHCEVSTKACPNFGRSSYFKDGGNGMKAFRAML